MSFNLALCRLRFNIYEYELKGLRLMNKKALISLIMTLSLLMSQPVFGEGVTVTSSPAATTSAEVQSAAEATPQTSPTPTPVPSQAAQPEDTAQDPEKEDEKPVSPPAITFSQAITPIILDSSKLNPPSVSAKSAVVMDAKSGTIIYTKNEHEKVFPASTTKIMTAILALEMTEELETPVTATIQALAPITNEDSHMGLLVGETLPMSKLIEGMLVASANDAANVIAIHIAGSVDAFAELMNQKAQSLGAYNTNFENANGMHDDNHYTSAYDLSIIAQYAMQNEKFREFVKQPNFQFPVTNKHSAPQVLSNTNLFLSRARSTHHIWTPVIGIKTGFTSMAGYCLVTAAQNGDNELISVVMNCNNTDNNQGATSYIESKKLLNFGFNNYKYTSLAKAGDVISTSKVYEALHDTRVSMTIDTDLGALLPKTIKPADDVKVDFEIPDTFKAPIRKGDALGTVSYTYQEQEIAYATLIAANDVDLNTLLFLFHTIINIVSSPFFFIPAILIIALLSIRRYNKKKREKRLRKTRMNNRMAQRENQNNKQREYVSTPNQNSRYKK